MATAPDPGLTHPKQTAGRFPLLAVVWPPLAGVLVAAVLATLASRPFRAFDTYFHLRFGDEFRNGWSLAHPGQVSTASTNDWAPTQWLPQIGMSWLADVFGDPGLVVLFAALVSGFTAAVYLLVRRHAKPGTAVTLTAVVLLGCLPSLSLRPQVLSYVFLVAVLASWDLARRTGRLPWWLVPLAWLWAASHGMWILGVGASAVLAVAVCLERRSTRPEVLRLVAIPAGMLLAACVTPVGPRLVSAILLVNARGDHFVEWRAPELVTLAAAPVTVLLALSVLLLVRRDGVRPYDIALLGLGCVFAIYSNRTLPLALVVLALVVARELTALRQERGTRADTRPAGRRELAVVAALAVGVVVLAPALPLRDVPADEVRPFAGLLDDLPDETVVLTDRTIGAVLLWTDPGLDIPMHGYGDVYTDAELNAYDDLFLLEPGWEDTLGDLDTHVALLPDDIPLAAALEERGWSAVKKTNDLVYLTEPRTG
ncbi:hypothetical protein [Nocardioides sp. WS12]|uniref:hypothetical protein n=1 Tax=Nocardioides sp. WS12 TaxID=2486272 RepID=UPI0015F91123|nr:hypothetical protein [Nocardioides sp. WS12]